MTPLTVFLRTLARSSAIFLGAGFIVMHPPLDMPSPVGGSVTAQKSPAEAALDGLVAALKDPDAGVRREAARALGRLGDSRAAVSLTPLLRDTDASVRWYAARALSEILTSAAPAGR